MSILVDGNTRLVVQGITGREGSFHTRRCIKYGTNVVAGVVPGKGGLSFEGVPVYNSTAEAVDYQGANASFIVVAPSFAADAIMEAASAGVELIVCITEGIPTLDMIRVLHYLERTKARLIGPNCPGVITPDQCKVGIMPGDIHIPGRVGVISRSGTLTYEAVKQLTDIGIGQSTCLGIGGDPVLGSTFVDLLELFEADPGTDAVLIIGEIGGSDEEDAARFVLERGSKPVAAFIAGRTAPAGRRMGHAGAIIAGGKGTAAEKIEALRDAGILVCENPAEIGKTVERLIRS